MKKALVLLLFSGFFISGGAAKINATIATSCPPDFEPLISMSDPDASFNNPGHPAVYDHKVCVKGIIESRLDTSCTGSTGFYLSSNTTHAHFSESEGYNLRACTGNMITSVRQNSCLDNQSALFSVSDRINGYGRHVAGVDSTGSPKVFNNVVCGYYARPENVSISMTFNLSDSDEVYFAGSQMGETSETGLVSFPYLVSTGNGETAGILAPNYLKATRELDDKNTLTLRRKSEKATFFIPFTQGDQNEIEDEEDLVTGGGFLNQLQPSFGFFMPDVPTVRVMLKPDVQVESSLSIGTGTYTVVIRNKGNDKVEILEQ